MVKSIFSLAAVCLLFACGGSRPAKKTDAASNKNAESIPVCLQDKIRIMADEPGEGSPLYVAQYQYKKQTVYYLASPCCDKYNVVYDSSCHVLGYPDGGFTGRGDGKMSDFSAEATNKKIIWEKAKTD